MERISLFPVGAAPIEGTLEVRGAGNVGRPLTFEIDGATIDGVVEELGAHQGVLRTERGVVPYFWACVGTELHLWVDGDTYVFELRMDMGLNTPRRAAGGALGDVTAPMPGVIRKVLVSSGDLIEAAAPLIVMESMKMQISLPAPAAGKVIAVDCAEGQMVDLGTVLLRLGPSDDE